MKKAIFFDLDGTLLPMDQDVFLNAYMSGLARKMACHGYEPNHLIKSIWKGTEAMVKNNGEQTNEALLWSTFSALIGRDTRVDEPHFADFYENEFQDVRQVCGFDERAAQTIAELKALGYRLILATNPLFPSMATYSRVRWAGLNPADFELITTYENSRHSKPNPDYYRDILEMQNLKAEECVMVGNDVSEDMVARSLGLDVFLLTDCLINKNGEDISAYPHGSFPELLAYIRGL